MPVAHQRDEEKQTNEIKMVKPLLQALDLDGMTITADALLTQRNIALLLVEEKNAHYQFIVKGNQKNLLEALELAFVDRSPSPDHETLDTEHGLIVTRKIWVIADPKLINYLDFPHVRQVFLIERERIDKKKQAKNQPPNSLMASPARIPTKPAPQISLKKTVAIGVSKIAATIYLTSLTTKIVAP